jgi:ABC-type uncharacterized transport system permease subunit
MQQAAQVMVLMGILAFQAEAAVDLVEIQQAVVDLSVEVEVVQHLPQLAVLVVVVIFILAE